MLRPILLALLASLATLPAWAQALEGNQRWAVFGTRKDLNDAIGMARFYAKAKVVEVKGGGYAVVAGPMAVTNEAQMRKDLAAKENYPADLQFTRGESYGATQWQPREIKPLAQAELSDERRTASLTYRDLVIDLGPEKKDDQTFSVVTARFKGEPAFRITFDDALTDMPVLDVRLAQIDASSPYPQVIMSAFTGGAHCCYDTRIATLMPDGRWLVNEAGMYDGQMLDLEQFGDAIMLVGKDDRFNYTYGSYAASVSPTLIYTISDGKLRDISTEPRFADYHLQTAARLEEGTRDDPDQRASPPYLAGWFAAKALGGQAKEAFARLQKTYDRKSDVDKERCAEPVDDFDKCPPKQRLRLAFPELVLFDFKRWGYPLP